MRLAKESVGKWGWRSSRSPSPATSPHGCSGGPCTASWTGVGSSPFLSPWVSHSTHPPLILIWVMVVVHPFHCHPPPPSLPSNSMNVGFNMVVQCTKQYNNVQTVQLMTVVLQQTPLYQVPPPRPSRPGAPHWMPPPQVDNLNFADLLYSLQYEVISRWSDHFKIISLASQRDCLTRIYVFG